MLKREKLIRDDEIVLSDDDFVLPIEKSFFCSIPKGERVGQQGGRQAGRAGMQASGNVTLNIFISI